jgi:hypothetical protein
MQGLQWLEQVLVIVAFMWDLAEQKYPFSEKPYEMSIRFNFLCSFD